MVEFNWLKSGTAASALGAPTKQSALARASTRTARRTRHDSPTNVRVSTSTVNNQTKCPSSPKVLFFFGDLFFFKTLVGVWLDLLLFQPPPPPPYSSLFLFCSHCLASLYRRLLSWLWGSPCAGRAAERHQFVLGRKQAPPAHRGVGPRQLVRQSLGNCADNVLPVARHEAAHVGHAQAARKTISRACFGENQFYSCGVFFHCEKKINFFFLFLKLFFKKENQFFFLFWIFVHLIWIVEILFLTFFIAFVCLVGRMDWWNSIGADCLLWHSFVSSWRSSRKSRRSTRYSCR